MNDSDDPVIHNARRDLHRESFNNANYLCIGGTKTERSDNAAMLLKTDGRVSANGLYRYTFLSI